MKRRGICILLAVMLCLGAVCAASAAAPDVEEDSAEQSAEPVESSEQNDESDESEEGLESAQPTTSPGSGLPEGAAPYDGAQESVDPTADDNAPDEPAGSDDAEATEPVPSNDAPADSESLLTIVGSGLVEVMDDGEWISFADWEKTAQLPQENVRLRAVTDESGDELTGVALDLDPVSFIEESGTWLFTVPLIDKDSQLVVSFGDVIPGVVTVVGPGTAWIMAGTEWAEIPEDQPVFEENIGRTVSILASPDDRGYAATELWLGNTPIYPAKYTKTGTVFEFKAQAPLMDIAVAFEENSQIELDIQGMGTVQCERDGKWAELENGARYPFDPSAVSEDSPLSFKAVPADGYVMGSVKFDGVELTATREGSSDNDRENRSPAATVVPNTPAPAGHPGVAPNPAGESKRTSRDNAADDEPIQVPLEAVADTYLFALGRPVNNGVLSVSFIPADNTKVEWLRGSNLQTGISWAIPLGTSTYGTSNVTQGSDIQITPLTSGAQYDKARTLATRFGSEFKVWDFTLVNAEGVAYEPTVPALFSLPIPAGYPQSQQYLRILHIRTDGQIMECPVEVRTDPVSGMVYIATKADTLSTFILVNTLSGNGIATPVPTYRGGAGSIGGAGTTTGGSAAPGTSGAKAPGTSDEKEIWCWILAAAAASIVIFGSARAAASRSAGR